MKIVVFGGAGFIGSFLSLQLEKKGHEVTVFDSFVSGYIENLAGFKGKIVKKDIRDQDAVIDVLQGVDIVFHLAAMNNLPECSDKVSECMEINVKGTSIVLESMRKFASKDARFVFTSSSSVYEDTGVFPTPEDTTLSPFLTYAISKLQGELLCRSYYRSCGLPTTIIRPFNVYGEGQDFRRHAPPLVSALTLPLLAGKQAIIYGDGKQARDFIHIEDMVEIFMLAAFHPNAIGETFNGGIGKSVSVLEVYTEICRQLKITKDPLYKPPRGWYDMYPNLLKGSFPYTQEIVRHEMLRTNQADTTKLKKFFNFEPKITIEEGIARSIAYIRKHL